MGLFDDLGKAFKKVEDEVKKSGIEKHIKEIEQGLNKAGNDISTDIDKARAPAQKTSTPPVSALPAHTSTGRSVPRSHDKGYAKIAAWVKRNYKDRITTSSHDSFQQSIQLEQLAAEACSGLPAKAKKGFMDYLKKQNYEPLLK